MSYPYPQDRNRDRKEKGEQPYKDAKEEMTRQEAEMENAVKAEDAPDLGLTEPGAVSDEMTERLRRIGDEAARERSE